MPFQSKSQARMMFALHPKIAKEWAAKTADMAKLPEKAGRKRPVTPKGMTKDGY